MRGERRFHVRNFAYSLPSFSRRCIQTVPMAQEMCSRFLYNFLFLINVSFDSHSIRNYHFDLLWHLPHYWRIKIHKQTSNLVLERNSWSRNWYLIEKCTFIRITIFQQVSTHKIPAYKNLLARISRTVRKISLPRSYLSDLTFSTWQIQSTILSGILKLNNCWAVLFIPLGK